MGISNFFETMREWIGGVAWIVFLWGIRMTEEQYIDELYKQERHIREQSEEGRGCKYCGKLGKHKCKGWMERG